MNKTLLYVASAALIAITMLALYKEGLAGMATPFKASLWTWQYFIDLVIALVVILFWIANDCKRRGKSAAPWIVATLLTGSLAPLIYLIARSGDSTRSS